jgi:hypothetical protein
LLDLTSTTLRSSLAGLFSKVYLSTYNVIYDVQMMSEGDLSVINQMRIGNYTPADFLA